MGCDSIRSYNRFGMMKRNYIYMIIGCLLAGMTACTNETPEMATVDDAGSRIYLSAGVGGIGDESRAPYLVDGLSPTTDNPLNVSVWATTNKQFMFSHKTDNNGNVFDGSIGNEVAIHTTARFQSGDPQLLGEAIYPKPVNNSTIDVYFVGLYPQSKTGGSEWVGVNDNKQASYPLTGKEDVMFAPRITGTYGLNYEEHPELIPEFHFYHLLTWLQVQMMIDNSVENQLEKEHIAEAWGKVKSLKLLYAKNKVTVDLTKADSAINKDNLPLNATFDGEVNMNFYHKDTDTPLYYTDESSEGFEIPLYKTDVAYVLCAPVTAVFQHKVEDNEEEKFELKPEYYLYVKTEHRELEKIPIDLKVTDGDEKEAYYEGSTMGKKFTILLNFKNGNVITVSTDISVGSNFDWYTHGTGTTDLTESDLTINSNQQ